jgi:acetate kinase
MDNALLILNAGSSSLKFAVYEADAVGTLQAGYRGVVEEIGRHGRFQVFHAPDAGGLTDHAVAAADHEEALQRLLDWLETRHPGLLGVSGLSGDVRVVMASAGDIPTEEALAATLLLRKHFPGLKVRFVNVVGL